MDSTYTSSVRIFVCTASLIIILAGIKAASTIVVPLLLSIFIAVACNPLIVKAAKYRVPRIISVLLVILMIVIFGFMLTGLVGQSMNEFSESMPQYKKQLSEQFNWLVTQLASMNIHVEREQIMSRLDPGIAMNMASNLLTSLGSVMTNFLLILLMVVFMLFESETIPKKVHVALDDPDMKTQQIDRFLTSVKDYLAIKTVVSLFTGMVVGAALYLLDVNHFLLWGTLAFLLNYIPNIGSMIAAVPPVLLALVQHGFGVAGATALVFVAVNTIMGNLVEPRLMGRGMGLSTLAVFLSLIFWGWLLGTVGMLLSVPLTMIVKIALESSQSGRWFALLLSDEETTERTIKEMQSGE